MNFHSVKTRFMGSYLFLLVLFIIQVPVIYFLFSGMSDKYAQVDASGALRKRAVEITEILNRHIMSGNEDLEKTFQAKKAEYGQALENLRKGASGLPAITGAELIEKLDTVEKDWKAMREELDKAMENGDRQMLSKSEVEKSTMAMQDKIEELGSPANLKAKNLMLSYLLERYFLSYDDKKAVGEEIKNAIADFDRAFDGVRGKGPKAIEAENIWNARKESILTGVRSNDLYHDGINDLVDKHTARIVAATNELTGLIVSDARAAALKGVVIMAASVFISSAFVVFAMWFTNKGVIDPIIRVKETVEDFSSGDLTKRAGIKIKFLGREFDDEITRLGTSVDSMASQMSQVLGRIADSSSHLASASEELSTTSAQINEGADRQSGQTAHVATAMEEMSATVIEVARNSQQASESARSAQNTASRGGQIVADAISAMKEVAESTSVTAETIKKLGKSSEEIGTIVSVINDIADQTNLLALNAAIEAARAGEQGRGFAVVADEVRKLAERTTKATKEISEMINAIQLETNKAVDAMADGTLKVENGVKLANEAGDALKQIVSGVENVTDMIGHIATSAEEQSATTEEITQNMDSIAEVAKSNVSAIGEVTNATNEMAHLASELRDLVSNFSIGSENEYKAAANGSSAPLHPAKTVSRQQVTPINIRENRA